MGSLADWLRKTTPLPACALTAAMVGAFFAGGAVEAQPATAPSAKRGMIALTPPGGPPPGPPDTSLNQWPTPEELASGKIDTFPGMTGVAFMSCGPADRPAVTMVFAGERAEVRIGLGRSLPQLTGVWQWRVPSDPTGIWMAAVCDTGGPTTASGASATSSCRDARSGFIRVETATATVVQGVWDVTFRHPVFEGGMRITGPFRARVISEPRQRCVGTAR